MDAQGDMLFSITPALVQLLFWRHKSASLKGSNGRVFARTGWELGSNSMEKFPKFVRPSESFTLTAPKFLKIFELLALLQTAFILL